MSTDSARDYEFTRADFEKIRVLIYRHVGISLADSKQQLVYSRLSRRLRALGLQRFTDYIALLAPEHAEWESFTNALTTNLTSFFREQYHFPILAEHARHVQRRPLQLWSAAASTGEEPYSMAMTMVDLFGTFAPPVQILATDVDTLVLETAQAGIYPLERIEKLSIAQRKKFLRKGRGENAGFAKVIPELQKLMTFRQLNLLDRDWPVKQKFDAIFCRNVMIYFDKPTQRKLIEKFVHMLQPDGLFFAGHSETFTHADDLISPAGKTVYRLGPSRKRSTDGVRMARNNGEQGMAPNRYFDKHFECEAVKILPGEYYVTSRDMLIVTVLGSCVSVCLRDKASGAGGMNHFMLPGSDAGGNPIGNAARYGSYAMEILINHLLKLGARRDNLEAKVFGGGRVLSGFNTTNVGESNASFVLHYLKTERIPIIAKDLLDIYPRKVYFFPHSGRVLVKKIKSLHNQTILERETEYGRKLKKTEVQGDVELFS